MQYEAQKMEEVFEIFKKIDSTTYPFSFGEFWRRKVRIETSGEHILSEKQIQNTYAKLSLTLKAWQWHRPYEFAKFSPGLKAALSNIIADYDVIRNYTLLNFQDIPEHHLKNIWNELGAVKDLGKNQLGLYLVMATTKPWMFIWGQTLAYDSIVRRDMPKFGITGLSNVNWTFEVWKQVTSNFSELLKSTPKLIDVIKEISLREYNSDSIVPYGQFMDLYIWASDPKRKCVR